MISYVTFLGCLWLAPSHLSITLTLSPSITRTHSESTVTDAPVQPRRASNATHNGSFPQASGVATVAR